MICSGLSKRQKVVTLFVIWSDWVRLWDFGCLVTCDLAKCTCGKGKGIFTLVQALRLCTGRMGHRGSRGIALLFHDHGTRRGLGVRITPRPLFTSGKDPAPTVQETEWPPGPVWTGAENLAPTGIRSPHRQARSQSLYRLRYQAHKCTCISHQRFHRAYLV